MRALLRYLGGGWFIQTNPPPGKKPLMFHGEHAIVPHFDMRHFEALFSWEETARRNSRSGL